MRAERRARRAVRASLPTRRWRVVVTYAYARAFVRCGWKVGGRGGGVPGWCQRREVWAATLRTRSRLGRTHHVRALGIVACVELIVGASSGLDLARAEPEALSEELRTARNCCTHTCLMRVHRVPDGIWNIEYSMGVAEPPPPRDARRVTFLPCTVQKSVSYTKERPIGAIGAVRARGVHHMRTQCVALHCGGALSRAHVTECARAENPMQQAACGA